MDAGVRQGAGVSVIAGDGVRNVDTPGSGLAGVAGAHVPVRAIEHALTDAFSGLTHIADRAGVFVGTHGLDEGVNAAELTVTVVGRARAAVVTREELTWDTEPTGAHVVGGAGVAINAWPDLWRDHAALVGDAYVEGAGVAVIAVQRVVARLAAARCALIAEGAGIAVVAKECVRIVLTAGEDVA